MGEFITESFYIPQDILEGLQSGLLERFGGVVRYACGPNKGSIAKHLKSVKKTADDSIKSVGQEALKFAKMHRTGIIISAAVISTVIIGGVVYLVIKNHVPKIVKEFSKEFTNYIYSIHNGTLQVNQIDTLMKIVQILKERKDFDNLSIKFSTAEILEILDILPKYTVKIANDNSVKIEEDCIERKQSDNIIDRIENLLEIQKNVFESAA